MVNGPENPENSGADILPFRRRRDQRPTVHFVESPATDDSEAEQADLVSEESMRKLLAYQGITDPKEQDEYIAKLKENAGTANNPSGSNVTPLDNAWSRRPKAGPPDIPEF